MAEEQEIMDEPQIGEVPDQEQGPGPKPVLSEERRKKLDTIVGQMLSNKESDDNIKKVISDFKGKYSVSMPKLDLNRPQQAASSESTSIPKPQIQKVLPGTTLDQMQSEKEKAHQVLHDELINNNDLIAPLIKKQKQQNLAAENLTGFAGRPRSDQPTTSVQQLASSLAPKTQEPEVTDQDVASFQQNITTNEEAGRAFLHHVADTAPEKAKSIQAALYTADAAKRTESNPNKSAKVLQNAKKIEQGKLVYGIQGGVLQKPEDAWESIGTGLKEKNKAFEDYDLFSKGTPEQSIAELEKRRSEHDPDEAVPVPSGMVSSFTGGMASQPLRGLIAGKVAGGATLLIPGGEEFAPAVDKFVTAAQSGDDFRKMSYAHGLQKYYNQLRNEGLDEKAAYEKANGQAKDESMVDALSGAAMMYAGGKIVEVPLPRFSLSEGFKSAVANGLKQSAKGVGEAGAVGLIMGAAQDVKNRLADMKGIQRDESGKDITEAIESGALFTLGMAALAKGASMLSNKTKTQILQGVAKASPEQVDAELGNQLMDGHITPKEAVAAKKLIDEHAELDQSVPDNITAESRMKILDKIDRRKELENELETKDKAYHPDIKEKIKAINEDILELSKDKMPKGESDPISQNENIVPRGTIEENSNIKSPESESLASGDVVTSRHLEGPQTVRSVSEDGKTVYVEGLADHHVHEIPVEDITLKVKQNASSVRSNPGQVQERGNAPEGGENPRGNDLQQPAQETPVNGEAPQQAGSGEVGKPPVDMGDLPFEAEAGDVNRLAHKDTEQLYEDLGTSGRVPRSTKKDVQLEAEADDLIRKGYDFAGKANRVLDTDEKFTDREQVAFAKMVGALKVKQRQYDVLSPEFDKLQDQIELLSRASDKAGSEEGAALRARQMFVLNDQSLSDYIKRDKESLKVDDLTPEQKLKNKDEFDEIQKEQKGYDENSDDLKGKENDLKAESEIKKAKASSKKGTKKTHDDYVKERKSLVDELFALKEKHEKELRDKGIHKAGVGFTFTGDMAKVVGKMLVSFAEEGIDKLEDVVKGIHEQIKDVFPGIEEKDVRDIIAGEYNEKISTKGDLAAKVKDLKDEATLINRLDRILREEEPKNRKSKIERNRQITDLRKQISDIQKEQRRADKENNTFYTEPKDIDRVELEALKKRNESELKKVQEQLAAGNFEKPEKSIPLLENKDLQEKFPNLFKRTLESADALIAAKKERELRLAKQEYESRSIGERRWDVAKKIMGLRRAINTAFDFSIPFRQAARVTMNPLEYKTAKKAFATMFKHTTSPKEFDRWFFNLEKSPDFKNMEKDGLYISSPDELRVSKREEQFQSDLASKIPLFGGLFDASQRAASAYSNQVRVDLYRKAAALLEAKGYTREKNPEAYESAAKLANNLTGRGNLISWLEGKPASGLSQIFYGPRLMAAKFNMLNPVFYSKLPGPIRKMALINMAGYVGFYVSVGMLAKAAGASVSLDRDSPDFMKLKVGDTKYDITGGESVYVRTFLRVLNAAMDRINGDQTSIKAAEKAGSAVTGFFRNKLAPNTSYALNAFLGKTSVGGEFQPLEGLKYYPMWIDDIVDDYKQDGAASILTAGVPSIFGIGVQTYVPKGKGGNTGGAGAGSNYNIKEWK